MWSQICEKIALIVSENTSEIIISKIWPLRNLWRNLHLFLDILDTETGVRCQITGVRCPVSGVRCCMLDAPPANSATILTFMAALQERTKWKFQSWTQILKTDWSYMFSKA